MKKKKTIGEPLPGPGKVRLGDVLAIPIGDGYWGYTRILRDASMTILSAISKDEVLELNKVIGSKTLDYPNYCEPWDKPTWVFLGNWPFDNEDDIWPPPKWTRDILNPKVLKIYHKGEFTHTKDESQVQGISENYGLLFPGRLVERIRAAHGLSVSREEIEKIAPFSSDWSGFKNEEKEQQFFPFCLKNDFSEYQLLFYEWDWLRERYGSDTIDGYYLNGHSVQALIKAVRISNDMSLKKPGMRFDSSGDYCRIEFRSRKEATLTTQLALNMISDLKTLKAMIQVVHKEELN